MPNVENGVGVSEIEYEGEELRVMLTCMECGAGFVLYRVVDGKATVRGRDTHLDTFLIQHGGCAEVPPLEVLVA